MFDIKKFLTEHTVSLTEDSTIQRLNKELQMSKAKAQAASHQYFSFPDAAAIKRMHQAMDKYEAVLLAVMKHVRSDYGKMSVR